MAKSPKTPDSSTPQTFEPAPADGIDPNVQVPAAVRAAAQRAEAMYTQPEPQPQPQPDPAPQPQPQLQVEPAPQPQPQPTPDNVRAPDPAPQDGHNWEHAYKSMKGRFDASQQEMRNLQQLVSTMSSELSQAIAALEQVQHNPPAPRDPPKPNLTEEDRQQFGDLLPVIQRAAQDMIAPQLDELRRENHALKQRLGTNTNATVKATLDTQVPTWTQINVDPAFKAWLLLPDIYSGVVRKQMLNAAISAGDASRVVAFFKGFLSETSGRGVDPQPQPDPAAPAAPAPRKAAVALETLAAPGRGGPAGGDMPVPVDKPVFTRPQIAQFYRDAARGLYTAEQKASIEAAIQAAQLDGRVRGAIAVGQMGVLK